MSKGKAITLGIFTVWLPVYAVLSMCMMCGVLLCDLSGEMHSVGPHPIVFMIMFPLHCLTMLDIFILLIIYIIHLFKTERVPQDKKALWAVVLFLGNMIAMPIYWYLYIWRKPEPSTIEQII